MSNLEIRAITAADHAAWLPLWQGYQAFYESVIPDEISAITWQRFLNPDEPMYAALAWLDGEAVGLVHWIFHRSCWNSSDYCYLQDLYAANSVRGKGVGRALIEHVYTQAKAEGASQVYWQTQESNTTAQQLYERIASRTEFILYEHPLR